MTCPLLFITMFLLCAAYGIFFSSNSYSSRISSMQKKDVEALEFTCNNIKQSFGRCKSIQDFHDHMYLKTIRDLTKRTTRMNYVVYARILGEMWAAYYNKKNELLNPTPTQKTIINEQHCPPPI